MIEKQSQYKKVGRLKMSVAKSIRRKSADIYIDKNHIKHIEKTHGKELGYIGLDAYSFVKLVVVSFNQIRKGSGDSLLLVIYNGKPKVVAIELNFVLKKGFYEVKTATIINKNRLEKKELLLKL